MGDKKNVQSVWIAMEALKTNEAKEPYEPFHIFRASRSGDRRILYRSETSHDRFVSSKTVKGLVGRSSFF